MGRSNIPGRRFELREYLSKPNISIRDNGLFLR